MFENEETYNECVTSGNAAKQLPPSMLENPELDQTKGVERCNCVCDYVDKQSSGESPTGLSHCMSRKSYVIYLTIPNSIS